MLLDEERCRRVIAEAFPGLEVRSARYFAAGWDYELWEINGELLVRFPLREECATRLPVEARLLAALADELSIAVPKPEHICDGCASFPLPFFAYRKLPGGPLVEAASGQEAMRSIGEQAGRFLTELHNFSTDRAAELGVPVYTAESWRQQYVELYNTIRSRVVPLMREREAQAVGSFWRELLASEEHFRFSPALIHGEFDDAHMLVDNGRLVGVIDFGDARVGDPAFDFAGCEGAFREALLASYGLTAESPQQLSARADVYRKISPFHAVLYGLDTDPEWVRRGMDEIRARHT